MPPCRERDRTSPASSWKRPLVATAHLSSISAASYSPSARLRRSLRVKRSSPVGRSRMIRLNLTRRHGYRQPSSPARKSPTHAPQLPGLPCGQVKRSRQSVADTWRPERSVRRYVVKSVTSSSASRSADGAGTDSLSTRQPVLHTQPGGLPRGSASRASPAAPSRSQLGGGATVQRPPASASCACVAGCSGSKSSGKLPCSARAASTNGPSGSSGQKESCISCRSAGRRERMASARQALSRAFSSSDRRRCSAWMSSR
mmetsp:Transcript_7428/g.24381  ORF Transcript_7428/g.24381 Transcript_7428/m.24381 type:complete len:258 (-) Transcript_7428:503-1276(-)